LDSLVEPCPHWRISYLYAIDSLRINPGGKGHERFFWAKDYDPDEIVRDVAKELYPRVRRNRNIPDNSSPRRPLITAVWWLFQAHRLSLNLSIDEEGSLETLASLMRRTTEKHDDKLT
jgi:hypothetical protein